MSTHANVETVQICKQKLIEMRQRLLNQSRSLREEFNGLERGSGDEIDQTVAQIAEEQFLLAQDRVRFQLIEIDQALHRIETGSFGYCEETQEPIERDRLLALPSTRLSIEGAEIRDVEKRRRNFMKS